MMLLYFSIALSVSKSVELFKQKIIFFQNRCHENVLADESLWFFFRKNIPLNPEKFCFTSQMHAFNESGRIGQNARQ